MPVIDKLYKAGEVYLLDYPEWAPKSHLCIILSDEPEVIAEVSILPSVFIVPVMTCKTKFENIVVLEPGDHPFIQHKSYVNYELLDEIIVSHAELLKKGKKSSISNELLQKIIDGVKFSKLIRRGVRKKFLEKNQK